MRIAVFSDVHANYSALETVLACIKSVGVDQLVFLGDIVGYGPDVAASIDLLAALPDLICLKGNHDRFLLGELPLDHENELVKESIFWAQTQVDKDSRDWMASWPLATDLGRLGFAHASGSDPWTYPYVWKSEDVLANFPGAVNSYWFYGHTHRLKMFRISQYEGLTETRTPGDYPASAAERYVINVGSVGQPRDGTWTAAYVLVEFQNQESHAVVSLRRVPYSMNETVSRMRKSGFSEDLVSLLHMPSRWKNN